jgi:WD40 repeat protein/serine/threonine protein kinase
MLRQVICPQGHRYEPVEGTESVCPECGAAASVGELSETFKPLDELPPLPVPAQGTSGDRLPFQLTGYEILEELGRGGMGVVFKARQISLNRTVALKMILGGAQRDELARFKTEAEACAQLHHPNIVQIIEIGERDGQPFIAFEFIEGGTLAQQLAATPVAANASARFVETLARAIDVAHAHKIIHRDLKPANVLLDGETPTSSSPLASRLSSLVPKITDFGLAKRLDQDSGQTRAGSILGTPSYMAPEQAAGNAKTDIGPAADIYALGAILYEMLTGRPPFRGVTPLETVQQVLRDEPVPPRRLQPSIPFDVETICLKCLAKIPQGRYETAEALADDLARFLNGQPIRARPTSWLERTIKWIKRHPTAASLLGAASLALVATVMTIGLTVVMDYNTRLERSLELNRRYQYLGQMNRAQNLWRDNQILRLRQLLDANASSEWRSFEWYYLSRLCHDDLQTFAEHALPVTCVAFSPVENLVASGSGKTTLAGAAVEGFGEVRLWDGESGKLRRLLQGHTREVNAVAFSRDGKQLATAGNDKTARLWKAATGESLFILKGHDEAVTCVAFHPDGRSLASGSRDATIKIWDVATGQEIRTLRQHREPVTSLAFNHDGTRLMSAGGDTQKPDSGEILEWEIPAGKAVAAYGGHRGAVTAVAFHPTVNMFASAGDDHEVRLWSRGKTREVRVLQGHGNRVTCLAFDQTGERIVSGSADMTLIIWDAATGAALWSRQGHTDAIRGITFSADGTRFSSASNDGTVKVWRSQGHQEFRRFAGHGGHVHDVAFSPIGQLLAAASEDHSVQLRDVATGDVRHTLDGHADTVHCVAFSARGDLGWQLVSGSADGTLRFWDATAGKEVARVENPRLQIQTLALEANGARLAYSGSKDGDASSPVAITIWDTLDKKAIATLDGHASAVTSLVFTPDGKRLASTSAGNLKVWDSVSGRELLSIALANAQAPRLAFSPNGRYLAVANGDFDKGTIRLLDARTGKGELALDGHTGSAAALAFTPDSERLVTTDGGKAGAATRIKLWDVQTGHEVLTLSGATGIVLTVNASPRGAAG